ncbi:hypothetical protein HR51_20980 [Burkholderia cepacia]|nr:hypothetical protein HR51_20980 [Burkholderia cepacia]
MNRQRVPAARRAAVAADRRRQSPNNATRSARRLTPAFEKIDLIWLRTALMHTPLYLSVLTGVRSLASPFATAIFARVSVKGRWSAFDRSTR